jgi:predicted amidophosphoribosyltransferase
VNLDKRRQEVVDLLFPKECLGCGKEGEYICDNCIIFLGESALMCPICDKSNFTGKTHSQCLTNYVLDGLVNFWEYEGITRAALHSIKYQGNFDIISEFIEKAFLLMRQDVSRFESFLSFIFSKDTYIAYVPMYIKKEKREGLNQSEIIAKTLGKITEKKTIDLLEKN